MTQRICPECRVGAHDHCACECEVCAHRYDHLLIAKIDRLEQTADGGVMWAENAEHFRQRAERAEARLAKATTALREMRTTYERNQHAQEWARFLETALDCCGFCGQEVDPRFRHECPAHYTDFSKIKLTPRTEQTK